MKKINLWVVLQLLYIAAWAIVMTGPAMDAENRARFNSDNPVLVSIFLVIYVMVVWNIPFVLGMKAAGKNANNPKS